MSNSTTSETNRVKVICSNCEHERWLRADQEIASPHICQICTMKELKRIQRATNAKAAIAKERKRVDRAVTNFFGGLTSTHVNRDELAAAIRQGFTEAANNQEG